MQSFLLFPGVSGCLDPNRAAVCSGYGPSFLQRRLDSWQFSFFLSANQPLADWRPLMCNNIPAGHRLLGGVCAGDTGDSGDVVKRRGRGVHPSKSALIKTARFIPSCIKSDKWLLAFSRRGPSTARGPSCGAIRPPLASWRSHHRISVFLFLTNRLIKRPMIDVQKIKALCVSTGINALNLHITNLKLRVFRSARSENTHHSSLNQALLQQR